MSVLGAIGNTPIVELAAVNPYAGNVRIFAKLEGNNPGGSVKDRTAYRMICAAEDAGLLGNGKTILEPTSGTAGAGLSRLLDSGAIEPDERVAIVLTGSGLKAVEKIGITLGLNSA